MTLHDKILKNLLSYKVVVEEITTDKIYSFCNYINNKAKEIHIPICKGKIELDDDSFTDFYSQCSLSVEDLEISGKFVDAYGSVIIDDDLLLNNYDADFDEENLSETGFVNIIGFATVNKKGLVRFSQVIYSFLNNKLEIRDDIKFLLPFIPDLENDFGGKRATYRFDNILSLRTQIEVYGKVGDEYKQSEDHKDDLSYPRLILKENKK